MRSQTVLLFLLLLAALCRDASSAETIDPNEVQMGPYVHDELPAPLLDRIKATVDVFEIVDGISYEQAVDLYRRDPDPEGNLVLWEEMMRAYKAFCVERCETSAERMDVYRALLIRSMATEKEALKLLQLNSLSRRDAKRVMKLYTLDPKPIPVVRGP